MACKYITDPLSLLMHMIAGVVAQYLPAAVHAHLHIRQAPYKVSIYSISA